jgi:hypothetical protein
MEVPPMHGFIVELQNIPGELARLAEALAERGINITGVSAATSGGTGAIGLTTNDEAGTRSALEGASIAYRELDLISISLADRPGTLADAARRLAGAGVNIELVMASGRGADRVDVIFGVADAAAARAALGDLAGAGTVA